MSTHKSISAVAPTLLAAAVIVAVALTLQIASGAYRAELSSPDESPHFVTGLMIRDYVAAGLPRHPLDFAIGYYLHYPKVAFGTWPPLLHVLEALVLLPFAHATWPALALVLVPTVGVALLLYRTASARWAPAVGLGMALFLISLPTSQWLASRVLADGFVALFALGAGLAWADYLASANTGAALRFGLFAGLSMLSKQNGLALLALPASTILLAGHWHLLKRRAVWGALILAGALGLPFIIWEWFTVVGTDPATTVGSHALAYAKLLMADPGPVVSALALAGMATAVHDARRGSSDPLWITLSGLVLCVVVFHVFVPNIPAPRYVWTAFGPLLLLAGHGASRIADRLAGSRRRQQACLAGAAALVCACAAWAFEPNIRTPVGMKALADYLAHRTDCQSCALVVSSRSGRDGAFIVEVAVRDRRPERFILRADKLFARSDWVGNHYEPLYETPDDIQRTLTTIPVKFVVIDDAGAERVPHHMALLAAVRGHPDTWQPVTVTTAGVPPTMLVFENRDPSASAPAHVQIDIDMSYSLGRTIGTAR